MDRVRDRNDDRDWAVGMDRIPAEHDAPVASLPARCPWWGQAVHGAAAAALRATPPAIAPRPSTFLDDSLVSSAYAQV